MVQSLHDSLCPITSGQEWGCGPLGSTSQAAPPPCFRLCQVPKLPLSPGAQSLVGSLLVSWLGLCTSGLVLGLLPVLWLQHRASNVHILLNTLTKTENTQVAYRKLRKDEKPGVLILHLM